MLVAAEGARACAALTAGFSVSSSRLLVSVERPGGCAGTVVNSAACADVPGPVPCVGDATSSAAAAVNSTARAIKSAAPASCSVGIAPVIIRSAPGVVPAVVIHWVSVMPIESPMTPAPSKTSEPTDSEAEAEIEVRSAKPNSGIRVPPRPRHYGPSVNQPRVVRGDVNLIGAGRLNADIRVLRGHGLLWRSLEIASFLRPPAHHLHRIHHILLLVVVSIAQR